MTLNTYNFAPGDLIITSDYNQNPGHYGILINRDHPYHQWRWKIRWFNGAPKSVCYDGSELEINLFNLRRRYHFYNKEGEYYEST